MFTFLLLHTIMADLFVNYNLGDYNYLNIYYINNTVSDTRLQCVHNDYGIVLIDTYFCYDTHILKNNVMMLDSYNTGYNVSIDNTTYSVKSTLNSQLSAYFVGSTYIINDTYIVNIDHTTFQDEFVLYDQNNTILANIFHTVCYNIKDSYYYVTVNDTVISNLIISQFVMFYSQYHNVYKSCPSGTDLPFLLGIIFGSVFGTIFYVYICSKIETCKEKIEKQEQIELS